MKTSHRLASGVLVCGLAAFFTLTLGAPGAAGEPRARAGQADRQVTRTGPGGQQRTWSESRSWQRGNGRFEGHRERTGPGGNTRSRDIEAERTESGRRSRTTWTDAQGREATRDAEVNVDRESRVRTRDVEIVGRDGETRTRQDTTNRTEDGYTRSSTLTGADGRQATREAEVVVDPDAGAVSKSVGWTGPDGGTASRTTDVTKTDTGRTATTTVTGADGSTVVYEGSVERKPEGNEATAPE